MLEKIVEITAPCFLSQSSHCWFVLIVKPIGMSLLICTLAGQADTVLCMGLLLFLGAMRGVMVSTSAFLACHQCYCAGSSLAWGLNLRALVCGIF